MYAKSLFMILTIMVLTSCATPSKHRYREGDNKGQKTDLTASQERKMTQEVLPQMKKDYPPIDNPKLQKYINKIGQKIVKANNLDGNPYTYTFTAVEVDYVNAFALPAGTVFVTAPLITMAKSEAELAGVIGHEIGHIVARHTAERMYLAKKEQKKSWLYGAGGALAAGVAGYGIGKMLCKGDKECLTKATLYGAGAGALGGLLVQKYSFMANSREDEMEADRIGFKFAVKAGYDKDSVGKFYERLLEMEKSRSKKSNAFMNKIADAMSTHPPSNERVAQMKQMAQTAVNKPRAITTTRAFTKAQKQASQYGKKKK